MYQIIILPHFQKQLKHYEKKYRGARSSLITSLESFERTQQQRLGKGLYKIRLAIPGMGKRSAFRVIILVLEIKSLIVPVTIYFKGTIGNMPKQTIKQHLNEILREL